MKTVERAKLADAVGTFGKFSQPTTAFANAFLDWAHYQAKHGVQTHLSGPAPRLA
jgi:hypothetical protein